jgi:alkanesulfonate monooxygenase SsuD/methylene tetrahydromethanopterin reductase-like flavin-dependent oxidoreductase (luciferase family)
MTMHFGLALSDNTARTVAELAQLAEESGWDGCFLGDAIWCQDPMIALAAAAVTTHRIRLGTMVTPVPLRRPWKLASESLALDHLSGGRVTLGLATGAVWMGWQAFPDEVTDARARGEMLDEMIDILTLLYQRRQFDYDGKHYHLKLTQMDVMHYPPKPVQQPRILLWAVGIWPSARSMARALKCDGVIVEKRSGGGGPEALTPADVAEISAYAVAHRTLTTPFDIVVSGKTAGLDAAASEKKLRPWIDAGATWWIEDIWGLPAEAMRERIREGPPRVAAHVGGG